MLTNLDPVDWRPARILIAGVTGAGKSTLARRIALRLGLPYTEIDALYHGANWTPRPSFLSDVDDFTSGQEWVTEWQYTVARPLLAKRADTLVWLDLPVRITLARVIRRTLQRRRTREVLWNGNVEPPLRTFFTDKEQIIRWALRTQRKLKTRVPELAREQPQLRIVRLRSVRQVESWFAGLPTTR